MPNTALTLYETRPRWCNYTPRSLVLEQETDNPQLLRAVYDPYGELRLRCLGRVYQYDHWKIEPDPKSQTEHITLFLTECRKES